MDFTGYEGLFAARVDKPHRQRRKIWPARRARSNTPRAGNGSVLFTIDNEGPVISEKDKARIFNKFYQGDSSHESEGNGLGLALVRKIIAIHGGEVWLEDPASGGCRFAVRLPMET